MENRGDYITYRMQRAEESYSDAIILAKNKRWNATINRLYYSCFYAVIALLADNEIESRSHNGSRNQFGKNFIKSGLIGKEHGKLYAKLFDMRQKGDYGDLYDFDEEIVIPLIKSTREFIDEIKRFL